MKAEEDAKKLTAELVMQDTQDGYNSLGNNAVENDTPSELVKVISVETEMTDRPGAGQESIEASEDQSPFYNPNDKEEQPQPFRYS